MFPSAFCCIRPCILNEALILKVLDKMAASNGLVWKDWRTARDQLKEWREESYRRSEEVVELGRRLLKDYPSALGDEGDAEQTNRTSA